MTTRLLGVLAAVSLSSCVPAQGGGSYGGYTPHGAPQPYGAAQPYGGYGYAAPAGPALHISYAVYRADNGGSCEATRAVRDACEGNSSCLIRADNSLCGDPARAHPKTLIIGYKCGHGQLELHVGERREADLSC